MTYNSYMVLIANCFFILAVLVWLYHIIKLKSIQNYSSLLNLHIMGVIILAAGAVLKLVEELNIISSSWWGHFLVSTGLMTAVIAAIKLIKGHIKIAQNLKKEAVTDYLTGAGNRKYLDEIWPSVLNMNDTSNSSVAVMLVDLDNFKMLNDRYGHIFGDEVLSLLVKAIRSSLRDSDHVIRYGGDEFIVILNGVNKHIVEYVKNRIVNAIEKTKLPYDEKIEISCGMAFYPEDGNDIDILIKTADNRMYQQKSKKKS